MQGEGWMLGMVQSYWSSPGPFKKSWSNELFVLELSYTGILAARLVEEIPLVGIRQKG